MVLKRPLGRSNLYRAICHSYQNFLSLGSQVIDSTLRPQAFAHFCARLVLLDRSLFNLQGTLPAIAEQRYLTTIILPCQQLFFVVLTFFDSCGPLGDSSFTLPHHPPLCQRFCDTFFRIYNLCQKLPLYLTRFRRFALRFQGPARYAILRLSQHKEPVQHDPLSLPFTGCR